MSILQVTPTSPSELQMGSALLARERLLPASELLASSLPLGGLQRGTTTVVAPGAPGSTTLALELLAGVSSGGHWCGAVGLGELGLMAALERGIELDRLLLVPDPGGSPRWQQVLASLFDGVEALLFAPRGPVRPAEARKVSARAKEKGTAFVVLDRRGQWPEPADLRCRVTSSTWSGLEQGHGLLGERNIEIEVSGRGAAARPRRRQICLEEEQLAI